MISLITSSIAAALVIVHLGYYALRLNQLPLWIVIVGVLAMVIVDFVLTVREETRRGNDEETAER